MQVILLIFYLSIWLEPVACELLQNGGFESMEHWECWDCHCEVTSIDKHSGQHSVQVSGRNHYYEGPAQYIDVVAGHYYNVSAWVKLLSDHPGQDVSINIDFTFADGSHDYPAAVTHFNAKTSEGWVHIVGGFTAPSQAPEKSRLYFQSGPSESVNFAVDDTSVIEQSLANHVTRDDLDRMIETHRKSNITVHVTTDSAISPADVQIHVVQTKKSFPFGTAISAPRYNANAAQGKYREFIHEHFNWAVPENALKWTETEQQRGQKRYQPALDMIHGVKSHGLKVRGHNLVWSVDQFVPPWVKQLSGDELRNVVKEHIQEVMNVTRGLLEHWDVNNENLHGEWYQTRLEDPDYDLELFRIAHQADPSVKLFLNDYSVVATGASTNDYVVQGHRFKAANVGLYGLGVQCHFGSEQEPVADVIQARLDMLAQVGVPIWATELDVMTGDEEKRADFYEKALSALYAHPAVEGILFWGFWDQAHWRDEKAALVVGDNLELTEAGRRVLDLFENQWMTDETYVLSTSGNRIALRGFHGDYEVRVIYQGKELNNLRKTFTLGKENHSVDISVEA